LSQLDSCKLCYQWIGIDVSAFLMQLPDCDVNVRMCDSVCSKFIYRTIITFCFKTIADIV